MMSTPFFQYRTLRKWKTESGHCQVTHCPHFQGSSGHRQQASLKMGHYIPLKCWDPMKNSCCSICEYNAKKKSNLHIARCLCQNVFSNIHNADKPSFEQHFS